MCFEFESWHWKARAKEMHKAQVKSGATEQKTVPAAVPKETERTRPEVKEPEKIPG